MLGSREIKKDIVRTFVVFILLVLSMSAFILALGRIAQDNLMKVCEILDMLNDKFL